MNLAAAKVVVDSSAASCCGTASAATPGSAFSAASISTHRSSWDVLPHEFLETPGRQMDQIGDQGVAVAEQRHLAAQLLLGIVVSAVFLFQAQSGLDFRLMSSTATVI